MSLGLKKSRIAEILSLIVLSIITIIAIVNKQVSVFYIIYLFWFDELLKTIFDFLKSRFQNKNIIHLQRYKGLVKSRFFMLGIYLIFILVCFGILLDWNDSDIVIGNFEVFFFKNLWFNISVLGFLGREIVQYYYDDTIQPSAHNIVSKGMLTLHLSIILGVLLWFFFSKNWDNDIFNLSAYNSTLAILPFVIIKFVFEIMEINDRHKSVNTSSKL
ncbi:DUF6498-containing protein [Winogradskyella thalassocola]|uniref:Uncharacterized protein n=1 Tax=Winogradskyella thalassocola TaxID=262004 RepID=A0A1G7WLQ6_9FLAO|nr:DUF6498-containing protein [Winogradskyella thalassocola]SDG72921.1 hypothetical protein SAMN04489796_101418 [Winogradskyella thalassocola]